MQTIQPRFVCHQVLIRFAKQKLCKCSTVFGTFLCHHYTTTTWKCLICDFHVPHNANCFPHKILHKNCFQFLLGLMINWKQFLRKVLWGKQIALWGTWKPQISRFVKDVDRIKDDDFLVLFQNFQTEFKNSTPEKFASIWWIERDGISAKKFEAARFQIKSNQKLYFASNFKR